MTSCWIEPHKDSARAFSAAADNAFTLDESRGKDNRLVPTYSPVPTYSLVVPAYNEEGVMRELAARLIAVMDALDGDAEAILVDDSSRDRTYEPMADAAASDPRIRVVRLAQLRAPDRAHGGRRPRGRRRGDRHGRRPAGSAGGRPGPRAALARGLRRRLRGARR